MAAPVEGPPEEVCAGADGDAAGPRAVWWSAEEGSGGLIRKQVKD